MHRVSLTDSEEEAGEEGSSTAAGGSTVAGVSAATAEMDDISFTLQDIGWNENLSQFTGIDKETFVDLIPMITTSSLTKIRDGVDDVVGRMHSRLGVSEPTADDVFSHVMQMRTQRANLKRRRADFLKRQPYNSRSRSLGSNRLSWVAKGVSSCPRHGTRSSVSPEQNNPLEVRWDSWRLSQKQKEIMMISQRNIINCVCVMACLRRLA